ncbi:hypothetical protein JIN84_11310 [Luteolibacter yonseiensis]|uniref:Uncharacterized protein n=1 Tax=Luteolibacter yonseiensis TaxID=1144680 RepID=A0A934VBR0_9BACT|nr:hypothetical protein [Luteolibacter yonseiensis]MBK1816201.1 hypothetical protein [Luteolibacter yonseiensis]
MKKTERIAWVVVVSALVVWNVSGRDGADGGGKPDRSGAAAAGSSGRHRAGQPLVGKTSERARRGAPEGEISARTGSIRSRSLNALRSADPVARMSAFLQVLSSCDATGLGQVEEAMEELKAAGIPLAGEEELMHFRAGQLNGAGLLADRTGKAEDFAELANVRRQYEGWIQSDPQAAGRWLDGLPTGRFRDQMAVAYITASTKDDPLGAFDLVATLHPSQQAVAGGQVAASATTEDAAALLWTLEANAGTGGPYLETMFTALAGKVAEGNDPAAVSLIEEHLDQPFVSDSALSLVSAAKAKFDPQGALHWAVEMETRKADRVNHGQVVSTVIEALSLEGLETAESWAAAQPDADALLRAIERRKEKLQDRQGGENKYDRDD